MNLTKDKKYLVEKRNVLNEVRSKNLTLQELRFFSIYLAKINARDISTRVVRFSLDDFRRILDLSGIKRKDLMAVADKLLCKTIAVPLGDELAFTMFQIFKRVKVEQDRHGEWYVEIDAHDDALPLVFDFKEKYFTYELWNALRLKSSNQLRMYEILKQYEYLGKRTISIAELKELLGIDELEYKRYSNFKTAVLEVCRKALEENTDIKFTYEPTGKRSKGGKVCYLKFDIYKNDKHIDHLSLEEFINKQDTIDGDFIVEDAADEFKYDADAEESYFKRELYPFFSEALKGEFDIDEVQVLYNLATVILPYTALKSVEEYKLDVYDYFKQKHDELNWRAGRTEITNRFGYLKKTIENELGVRGVVR